MDSGQWYIVKEVSFVSINSFLFRELSGKALDVEYGLLDGEFGSSF